MHPFVGVPNDFGNTMPVSQWLQNGKTVAYEVALSGTGK
jgi:hypothetical protein